jgi:hypothetical protein
MTAKLQVLRSRPEGRTPEREALAAAIQKQRNAECALTAARDRLASTRNAVDEAKTALANASAAVATAKQRLAANIAKGSRTAIDVKTARASETDAADQLEAAEAALAANENDLSTAEHALRQGKDSVSRAVDAVIGTSPIEALFEATQAAQADLIDRRLELRFLLHSDLIADPNLKQRVSSFLFLNDGVLPGTYRSIEAEDWDKYASQRRNAWQTAREALRTNAEAPIPEQS